MKKKNMKNSKNTSKNVNNIKSVILKKKSIVKKKPVVKAIKVVKKEVKKEVKKTIKKEVKKNTQNKKTSKTSKPFQTSRSSKTREFIIKGKNPSATSVLEGFFEGPIKLKLWKIFALNKEKEFTLKDISRLTKTKIDTISTHVRDFMKKGIIQAEKKNINNLQNKDVNIYYKMSQEFPLLQEITKLILTAIPRSSEDVLSHISGLERLKTVILSGFFTSEQGISSHGYSATQSPIDMLLIFEKTPNNVSSVISDLEHKLGRDLTYAALDENDFKYRHSIGDKLIRDVLDFDHIIAMDKLSFFR